MLREILWLKGVDAIIRGTDMPNGIFLHMAVKLSRHQCQCFAFSYHIQREISYKSVPHIPVCPRLAAKVWLVWPWPYQFL